MAKKATTVKSKLTLNVQHDFITLRAPHGTFTVNRNGAKASGVFTTGLAFEMMDRYVHAADNLLEGMKKLTDERFLSTLAPGWDIEAEDVEAGDTVVCTHPVLLKNHPGEGDVEYVKKKYAFVWFKDTQPGPIGIEKAFLRITKKKNKA